MTNNDNPTAFFAPFVFTSLLAVNYQALKLFPTCPANQPDVPEVRRAAAAATPALQEHPAGATVRRTLEVFGRRHPGATYRPE